MIRCDRELFVHEFGKLKNSGEKFIFIINYDMDDFILCISRDCAVNKIFYNIKGETNTNHSEELPVSFNLECVPPSYEIYRASFLNVMENLKAGNSYLANLTFRSEISPPCALHEIFLSAAAPYKLCFDGRFTVFSPECFVKIHGREIITYPMKGTVSSMDHNALDSLMESEKEKAEHITVVDLLRNDLSMVSDSVKVERYRYSEIIKNMRGGVYQTSSEIRGILRDQYAGDYAGLLLTILPAGSVTGAPKKKTVSILKDAEKCERGFYTGVFGICCGDYLDSAVMIRFIENENGRFYFKSGGGITVYSDPEKEYNELLRKIYVPVY